MRGGRGGRMSVESNLCFFFNWTSQSSVGWGKTLKFPKFLYLKLFRHINKFFCVLTSKNFETEFCWNTKLYKNESFKQIFKINWHLDGLNNQNHGRFGTHYIKKKQ